MSAATAIAFDCRTLEKDPTPAASVFVECESCDPDNPIAVPRKDCQTCKGTGQAPIALVAIVTEMHEAKLELLKGGKDGRGSSDEEPADDGEYDDWCDPDDLC